MGYLQIFKLQPRGSFHFGERGVGLEETGEFIHSDTLFSALASAWRLLGGRYGETSAEQDGNLKLLSPFRDGEIPFKISSAFPCAGDTLLLPRPNVPLSNSRDDKGIRFVSEGAWRALSEGRQPDHRTLIHGKRVWVTAEERRKISDLIHGDLSGAERKRLTAVYQADPSRLKIWGGQDDLPVTRVSIDRVSSRSELYQQARLTFAEGCGLYFWAEIDDAEYQSHIEAALRFLEDHGLGGRRSIGHGQFTYAQERRDFPMVSDPNCQVTLSLYRPAKAEVAKGLLSTGQYGLIDRRGWIDSPDGRYLRHRTLRMISEGGVFPRETELAGTMPDVRPQMDPVTAIPHPVWRYGYALALPLRLRGALSWNEESHSHSA